MADGCPNADRQRTADEKKRFENPLARRPAVSPDILRPKRGRLVAVGKYESRDSDETAPQHPAHALVFEGWHLPNPVQPHQNRAQTDGITAEDRPSGNPFSFNAEGICETYQLQNC